MSYIDIDDESFGKLIRLIYECHCSVDITVNFNDMPRIRLKVEDVSHLEPLDENDTGAIAQR